MSGQPLAPRSKRATARHQDLPQIRRRRGTGTVRQRADGLWEARLPPDHDGSGTRPRPLYAASRPEAEAALEAAIRARVVGRAQAPSSRVTVGSWLDTWLADGAARWAPATRRGYGQAVRLWLRPRLGSVPLARLSRDQVENAVKGIAAQSGTKAAKNAHAVLRAALASAERAELVTRNVARLVIPPTYRRAVPDPWTLDEAKRFRAAIAGHPDEALWLLAIMLGPRQGELLALGLDDIDLEAGIVTIRGSLTWAAGVPYVKEPKNEWGRRSLRLPTPIIPIIRSRLEAVESARAAAGTSWHDNRLLFCDDRGRPRRGDVVTQQFHRFIERQGLPKIRFYDLRRTATVLLLVGTGGDDVAVGATLGHSRKSNMVRDVYAYLPPEVSAKVADAISDLLATEAG